MHRAGLHALVAFAPAKVNIYLEVTGLRPDGFHALETLMVPIDLFDTLELADDPTGQLRLTCHSPGLPTDHRNLVMRAAQLVQARYAPARGAQFHLTKRIPSEAGLGGGSSDAATTLRGLNQLWQLNLPAAALHELAAVLGSDVPFFLAGTPAWCTGRGEKVEPLPLFAELHFVVVKPPVGLGTAAVYAALRRPEVPRADQGIRDAYDSGDIHQLSAQMFNRLAGPAGELAPVCRAITETLRAAGAAAAQVTGSGAAVVALGESRAAALTIASQVRAQMPELLPCHVFVVRG
ncbi:MAG: 4-(cytidine 5'-diphospho)-2-C-methyl-D-erythritol kinase, partial [Gemmataceae bacterium]